MTESMISLVVGIVVMLCIAAVLITRRRSELKAQGKTEAAPKARWLDTHPLRDWWMRHRH